MIKCIKIFSVIKYQKNIVIYNEYCARLSAILLDSILVNSDKEYYPHIFLEECKYAIIKK